MLARQRIPKRLGRLRLASLRLDRAEPSRVQGGSRLRTAVRADLHRSRSTRQLFASLLAHHVLGVPVWPVWIGLPRPCFVLAVGALRTPKRTRQIVRRREARRRRIDTTGQPRRDLLEQPAVAIRITERGERAVAAMLRIRTADPDPPKQVGRIRAGIHASGTVEHFADGDAATEQLVAGGLDVGDDQVQALGGAGLRGGDVLAEDHRAARARRRELDHAVIVTAGKVGVEPPSEPLVELFCSVHIRDGDDDHLKLGGVQNLLGTGGRALLGLLGLSHGGFLFEDHLRQSIPAYEPPRSPCGRSRLLATASRHVRIWPAPRTRSGRCAAAARNGEAWRYRLDLPTPGEIRQTLANPGNDPSPVWRGLRAGFPSRSGPRSEATSPWVSRARRSRSTSPRPAPRSVEFSHSIRRIRGGDKPPPFGKSYGSQGETEDGYLSSSGRKAQESDDE